MDPVIFFVSVAAVVAVSPVLAIAALVMAWKWVKRPFVSMEQEP